MTGKERRKLKITQKSMRQNIANKMNLKISMTTKELKIKHGIWIKKIVTTKNNHSLINFSAIMI